ncbi:hypothetical protein X769_33060 [Mesorhizobium sp. LSJC268A00]|uniref:hypothetical protein n=1 Tax=unclassified Mesorhizobium TaxID=325217 RepID=UPI0003CE75D5|nr:MULTISPECIES: hypothetical protein [unclassified Mesorhizobium]ESW94373.1 hypothetical protein X769_33060 [Mesorhizobium sp. LSJC268A00]ESW94670.1 hypothetical protein X768_33775 [Mesorhizobium sp. LSJC265A00]ESZ01224.1 hypothetical protein X736_32470 [Mesorhizobium sp. L2C089B000]ESZ23423.1 hypothetical protein X733_33135 [Mesorhizobium sp. L2C067A000]WJI52088.1 hypothetical protein NLY44_05155 [Mesorhizobium sp. C089B]
MSGIDLISNLAATMAPVMEQMGVIAASELGPETLQDRIRAEAYASGSVVVGRYEVGCVVTTNVGTTVMRPRSPRPARSS